MNGGSCGVVVLQTLQKFAIRILSQTTSFLGMVNIKKFNFDPIDYESIDKTEFWIVEDEEPPCLDYDGVRGCIMIELVGLIWDHLVKNKMLLLGFNVQNDPIEVDDDDEGGGGRMRMRMVVVVEDLVCMMILISIMYYEVN
uniref:Uncharacterized protein n=1 Tax=Fagus sylvatica TaxID=28930 RepID=A0A2N9G2B0_FAGSY